MAITQYIGSRYVPLFAEPIEWSSQNTYEPLTIVLHEGNSYTSRQAVPKGIAIDNEDFWALTGNYNAQVEQYRREAVAAREAADAAQSDIETLLPKADFSASNTVRAYIDSRDSILTQDIADTSQQLTDNLQSAVDTLNAALAESESKLEKEVVSAANVYDMNLLNVIDLLGTYGDYAFIGTTPQALAVHEDTAYLFIAQLAESSNTGVDILAINLNNSRIIGWYVNTDLKHCNAACYNPTTRKMYVADDDIYILNMSEFQIERHLDIAASSICYDKVTGKMYVHQSNKVYEFDPVTNTLGDYLFETRAEDYQHGYSYAQSMYAWQNIAAWDGVIYYAGAGLNRSAQIAKYVDNELEQIMVLKDYGPIYSVFELQGVDFTYRGDLLCAARLNVGTVADYAGIYGINLSGLMNYGRYNLERNSNNIYCGVPSNAMFVGVPYGTNSYPFRTLEEALQAAKISGSAKIYIKANSNVKTNPNVDLWTFPMSLDIAGTLTISQQIDVHSPIVLRGSGYIEGTSLLRFWNTVTISGVKFRYTGDYFCSIYATAFIFGVTIESGYATAANCAYRGIASAHNSNVTLTNPGTWGV